VTLVRYLRVAAQACESGMGSLCVFAIWASLTNSGETAPAGRGSVLEIPSGVLRLMVSGP